MANNMICNCGGTFIHKNGRWVCDSCGRPMPQILDSRENQLLAVAQAAFTQDKFLEAEELYGEIVKSFPQCYSAYWGLALARHGIKYVDDLRTGKKVATCWAPEISSIKEDKYYKKVLSLAPANEKPYYEEQGDVIEKIRLEWKEKAKKVKPYDVFICFKDTDDETKGRTQDSVELADLYNNLTRDKYNVFFSRYSLDGIVAENYEPYIFQALSTAKVMIVYGSKEEYFESTWMKNEWTRFLRKVSEGRKQKNALLPVVKGISPNALPTRLRTLQVLDASKNTFYSDLTKYVDKVLAASDSEEELQRSEVKFTQRKRVERQQARNVRARSLQMDEVENISAQGEQLMKVIGAFVQQGQFKRAEKYCDAWIKSNPTNYRDLEELVKTMLAVDNYELAKKYVDYIVSNAPERKRAKLWQLMIGDGYSQIDEWALAVTPYYIACDVPCDISLEFMQQVLPLISENELCVLYAIYKAIGNLRGFDESLKKVISYVLEFEADEKEKINFIKTLIKNAIKDSTDNYAYFDFVITFLKGHWYNDALADFVEAHKTDLKPLKKVLPLLEGELYFAAHTALIKLLFSTGDYADGVAETEILLGYIKSEYDYNCKLDEIIAMALNALKNNVAEMDDHLYRLLSFKKESSDKSEEYKHYDAIVKRCCEVRYRQGVERYAKLMLGCGAEGKYYGYYYLMLVELDCFSDKDIARLDFDLADSSAYNTWLANCEDKYLGNATKYLQTIDDLRSQLRSDNKVKDKLRGRKIVVAILVILGALSIVLSIVSTVNYGRAGIFFLPVLIFGILIIFCASTGYSYTNTGLRVKHELNGTYTLYGIREEYNNGTVVIPKFIDKISYKFGENLKAEELIFEDNNNLTLGKRLYGEFANNKYLRTVVLPNGLTSIGRWTFEGCNSLTSVTIPSSVTSIGDWAFRGCSSLTSVIIPSSVTSIGDSAFSSCSNLTSVTIPSSVTSIGYGAFWFCGSLTIYCEVASQPSGWSSSWKDSNRPVVWGYKGD